jgi:DNA-binding MarR family transcriptional regulator
MSIEKPPKARPAEPVDESLLENSVIAMATLAGLLRHDVDRAAARTGLSQPMCVALGRLTKLPDQTATVGVLAHSIGCNMGNLSGTLDRLEAAGCIERIVGEADRRARFIRVTAKGRKMAAQISGNFHSGRIWTTLKQMNAQQLEALTASIQRLNDALNEGRQDVHERTSGPRTTDLI